MSNIENYNWHVELWLNMLEEYSYRYKKFHASFKLYDSLINPPKNISKGVFNTPPQCMPDRYKSHDTINSYRSYYAGDKWGFSCWKNSHIPDWFINKMEETWHDENESELVNRSSFN